MKKITFLLLFISYSFYSLAQSKLLTIEEAVGKGRTTLAPEKLKDLQWITQSNKFCYYDKTGQLIIVSAENLAKKQIVTVADLNKLVLPITQDTLTKFPTIDWLNENEFTFSHKNFLLAYNTTTQKISATGYFYNTADLENVDKSTKAHLFAYTKDHNVCIQNGRDKVQVTTDGSTNLFYGEAVHRNEFGINKGLFWSPQATNLAFYRMDQSMVTDYPIVNWKTAPATVKNIKYPFAGQASHEVTVGIYNLTTQKITYLKTGMPADQYLTNICWAPDEKIIYVAVLNREQNHLKYNAYDPISGNFIKTIFEEKDNKYVEPLHEAIFNPINPNVFIWQSNTSGYNHILLVDLATASTKPLTKGNWAVTNVLGFDTKGTTVYYTSTEKSPLNNDLYSININTLETKRLTQGDGQHAVLMNDTKTCFLDNYTSTSITRKVTLNTISTKKSELLLEASNPLLDYKLGKMKIFTIKNNQGIDLYCRMFLPVDFDSTKKHPVLVYLYGGPHNQLIKNTWLGGAELWYQYMAQKGFIVFSLDNRGSENRGKDFEQATFRNLGDAEMEDQLCGVNYLKTLPYVNSDRLGVHGWSFGGFMTTSLMTRGPKPFKIGVAGGPVIDWSMYEVMYTERYMDTPQTNADGYKKNSLFNYIGDLKGKLLLIHGTDDDVVVWQHSLQYLQKSVEKGKQIDYYVYPGHKHNVIGKDRVHLMKKVTDYFIENL